MIPEHLHFNKVAIEEFAKKSATSTSTGYSYLYEVQTKMYKAHNVNNNLGKNSPFPHEREIAYNRTIRNKDIIGAWQVDECGRK